MIDPNVPAQITTIEDTIVGNISVQQGLLLMIPVLFGFIITLLFPPFGQFVLYKIVTVIALFMVCGLLAMRIRGRIIAKWIGIFIAYSLRPRYFVYDKNSTYLRPIRKIEPKEVKRTSNVPEVKKPKLKTSGIAAHEFARLEELALDKRTKMRFEVGKKGKLNVRITEIQ